MADWQRRAAAQSRQVHEQLVELPRDLRARIQADELRIKRQGAIGHAR